MWFSRNQQAFLQCLLLISLIQGNGIRACPLSVIYPRAELRRNMGDSLTLNCTVRLCADPAEEPMVHWCKLEAGSCQPVPVNKTSSNDDKGSSLLVSYTIASLNFSDSGTFRCEASQGMMKSMGHSIVLNVFEASGDPVILVIEHVDNTYKWYFLLLLLPVVVTVSVALYCRGKRQLAQKRQRAQGKNVAAASSAPNLTMVTTELSSVADMTEPNPVKACVNKRCMEPLYVNEPFLLTEPHEKCIYVNDLLS